MAEQKQDDQHEHTFSNYVSIHDVVQKTCLRRWTIGRSGERGSGISVLPARHDDDGDDYKGKIIYETIIQQNWNNEFNWLHCSSYCQWMPKLQVFFFWKWFYVLINQEFENCLATIFWCFTQINMSNEYNWGEFLFYSWFSFYGQQNVHEKLLFYITMCACDGGKVK